jgi:hypothetical protein
MDSSVNTAKPYKEKNFRSKLPVKRPRPKKEPVPAKPVSVAKVGLIERLAIDKLQAKLIAEDRAASAIQNAIRGNLARKAVKTTRASKAKPKNEIVAKSTPKPKNEIVAKATTPKPVKELKPRAPRAPKPVYKISYATALKIWNSNHNTGMYCNPKKNTDEYKAVQALRL